MRFQKVFVAVFVVFGLNFKCSEQAISFVNNNCILLVLPGVVEDKELCDCTQFQREVHYKNQTKYWAAGGDAVVNIADVEKCGPFPFRLLTVTIEQCGDTGYVKLVFYKNTTFVYLKKGVAVKDIKTVFGCYLIIGSEYFDTSGKGYFPMYGSTQKEKLPEAHIFDQVFSLRTKSINLFLTKFKHPV